MQMCMCCVDFSFCSNFHALECLVLLPLQVRKAVTVEHLAAEFGITTKVAVARIEELLQNGQLTGVTDDRGKFIYVTDAELQAIADVIRAKGRLSLADMARECTQVILSSLQTSTTTPGEP